MARKGDGLSYEPAFQQPLHAGAEFRLRERRGTWLFVELRNGASCWLPQESVELARIFHKTSSRGGLVSDS